MHLNRSFCPRQKNPGFVIFRPPAISETGRTLKKAGDGLLISVWRILFAYSSTSPTFAQRKQTMKKYNVNNSSTVTGRRRISWLPIYKRGRGVELGITENNTRLLAETGLRPRPWDFKSGALTIQPRYLQQVFSVTAELINFSLFSYIIYPVLRKLRYKTFVFLLQAISLVLV